MSGTDVDLERTWTAFSALTARAAGELARGRLERAAVAAQVAATYAWFNHPGVFASRALEEVVRGVGQRIDDGPATTTPARGVLHVATEVYATGGHTRMLTNWIGADPGEHRVCLTGQRGRPVPGALLAALVTRGTVTALDEASDDLLGRARALRALAATAGCVVLHVHPHDVVPGLALAGRSVGGRRPARVLTVDHADHVFWVGTTTPDVVVHLRRSGAELAAVRRGVTPGRSATLIRPLEPAPRRLSRAQARARLGVPDGRTLLVTAAAGSKYDPVDGVGFLDLVRPLLEARPDAHLLAAGPSPTGEWAALEADGLGRATGLLPDVRPLLEAADVYLDSHPFSSLTSLLEAAALGVPVVTLREEADVLGADTPELDEVMLVATSPAHHRRLVVGLLDDPAAREALGARTGRAVTAAHADGAWARAARALLDAPAGGAVPCQPDDVRRTGALDQRVARLQLQTGFGRGVAGAERLNASLLPLGRRVVLAARLVLAGGCPEVAQLFSARTARRLRGLRASWRGGPVRPRRGGARPADGSRRAGTAPRPGR